MITRGMEEGDFLVQGFYATVAAPTPTPAPPLVMTGGAGGGGPPQQYLEEEECTEEMAARGECEKEDLFDEALFPGKDPTQEDVEEEFVIPPIEAKPKSRYIDRVEWAEAVAKMIGDSIQERALPPVDVDSIVDKAIGFLGHPNDPESRFNWIRHKGFPTASLAMAFVRLARKAMGFARNPRKKK
jgi:hypothetical protein